MAIERPLHWRQGLFLQPQHFQLLERSFKALVAPYQRFLAPTLWGIGEIGIQKAALEAKSFEVTKGSFLFPDGSYVVLPDNAVIEPRPFDDAWVEGGKPLTVYVGLKKWNDIGENVVILEKIEGLSGINARFAAPAEAEEVKDLHSGGPEGQVERLFYLLRLFFETEVDQSGDYQLIPIAQLVRMGDEVRLSDRFIPPTLTVGASETLFSVIKEIRDQITARGRQLEELKRQRGVQTAEFGSRDMVYLLALRSLNRYIPLLAHVTDARQVHPWAVYGLLRQLIGELSAFSEKVDVMGRVEAENWTLPAYDHEKLWESFSSAQALISRLLDEITAGPEYVVRLVYDGTYFAADLKPAVFEGKNRFFLVLRTETDSKLVVSSVANLAKLSSREHMPLLIARALPSIALKHLQVPPQELPRRLNSVYFAIDHHGEHWGQVQKGNNIALYWDNAPKDLEVELMVVSR